VFPPNSQLDDFSDVSRFVRWCERSGRAGQALLVIGGLVVFAASAFALHLLWFGQEVRASKPTLVLSVLFLGIMFSGGYATVSGLRSLSRARFSLPTVADLQRELRLRRRPNKVCMTCRTIVRIDVPECAACGFATQLFTVESEEDVRVLMLALGAGGHGSKR